jgi:uncharacterized iron-regulated membrane protein
LVLHNVIGVVAIVPLLIWGLAGLNFKMPGFSTMWYSATGGEAPPEDNYSMHYGHSVNPYWRALWFVLGLAPLLLLLIGVSTWLYRRQVTRRRRAAQVMAD